MATENYLKLEDDIIDFFNERLNKLNTPVDLKFLFVAYNKQKHLIKIVKIPEQYAFITGKELFVSVNTDYYDSFEQDIKEILFDQELSKIEFNLDKGTLKVNPLKFATNKGIIDKYTYDQVERAIEVEQLYEQQKKDSKKDSKNNKKKI